MPTSIRLQSCLIAMMAAIVAMPTMAVAQAPQSRAVPSVSAAAPRQPSQALNPPYLSGFPSIDTVKSAIQGSNPVDTLARQVAVLNYLPRIIQRMQMVPGRRYNSTTPDEQRLIDAYGLASYELSQGFLKSASPENAKTFQQTINRYEMNPALSDQMFALLSPATLAEFGKIDAAANAQAQARINQQRLENEAARAPRPQPASGAPVERRNDPTAVATRRCLESGGSELECLGRGLTTGLLGTDTILPKSTVHGVRLGGMFQTTTGVTLDFAYGNANISSCGKLELQARGYSVTRRGDLLQVTIETEPKPLLVVLGPDGRITGPASFDLSGEVIVGYQTNWVETRTSDNVVVPGSGHQERVPMYERRIARCAFAALRPTGPTTADVSLLGVGSAVFGAPADSAAQQAPKEAPAGARFEGVYAGAGGLRFEFRSTAVEVECGDVHTVMPYTVQNSADRLVITVRNGNAAVPLALAGDGSLTGSGSIDVTGRAVTGVRDSGVTFASRTARCALGVLSPK